ncbi:hypothetical protein MAPG_10680 [Magnaporthiopsis poae ATCC 64411]|uniref:Uncharacterized protein n=1 Tax=Magnaporthiopsis poae (strain ATCC 64411 / 73-15) TaxID=644358 RepID=A0A0C4ED86_MAGP6|nr:hypothetical protein MAPG_10680 [Magnaporthiopsis poae ATCC 64411]
MRFDLSYLMALIAIGALPAMATDQDDALAQRDIQTGAVLEGAVPVAKRSAVNMDGFSTFLAKYGPHGSEARSKYSPKSSPKVTARSPAPVKGRPGDLKIPPGKGFSGRGTPRAPGRPKPAGKRPPKLKIPGQKGPDPNYKSKAPKPIEVPGRSGKRPAPGAAGSPDPKKPKVEARSPAPAKKGRPPPVQVPPSTGFSGRGTPRAPGRPKPVGKRPPKIQIPGRKKDDPKYKSKAPKPIDVPGRSGKRPAPGGDSPSPNPKKPKVEARSY